MSIGCDRGRCRRFVQPSSVRVRSGYGPQRRHREILRMRRAGLATQAHVELPTHRAREDASPPSGAGPYAPVRWECQAILTGVGSGTVRLHVRSVTTRPILWDMVGPGQVTCSGRAVRARGAAGEQSAHGAESPGMHVPGCCAGMQAQPWRPVHAPPARGRCRLASKEEGGGRRPSCALQYGRPIRRCGRGRHDYHQ